MARIRSVHPDICLSATMADLSARYERTFVRLWTHCDDHGRCVDNSRLIKAAIYPLLDAMTPDVLDEELRVLSDAGLILRYEVAGKRLIQVVSWDEFQHPNRPKDSKFPAPSVSLHALGSAGAVLEMDVCTPGEGEATERAMHAHAVTPQWGELRQRHFAPKPLRESS